MTPDEFEEQHSAMQEERRFLASLAFTMLGSVEGTEDAVQKAYISWYYLTADEQDAVATPRAWLTRALGRACLAKLANAYGEGAHDTEAWMPKAGSPDVGAVGPMTPAERVSLVLRDSLGMTFEQMAEVLDHSPAVCRRITDAARRRSMESPEDRTHRALHDAAVREFADAVRFRDGARLRAVLDAKVALESGGDGGIPATRTRMVGALDAARCILDALDRHSTMTVLQQDAPNGVGLALWDDGRIVSAASVEVGGRVIRAIRLQGAARRCC